MTVAYHGTKHVTHTLNLGLRAEHGRRPHVCLAVRPEVAANFGRVLSVNIDGLAAELAGGEYRVHADIDADRLSLHDADLQPDWRGFTDPATYPAGNHPACARRRCWE